METQNRPSFSFLAKAEIETIISEAIEILGKIGIKSENSEGEKLLLDAGSTKENDRIFIKDQLIHSSVQSLPKEINIYDRNGDLALELGGSNVYFNPGSAAIHIFDPGSRKRRNATTEDVIRLASLVDSLKNYAAQSTALTPSDIPEEIGDRFRLYIALKYCKKPIITGTFRKDGFAPMVEMMTIIRGSAEKLRDKPLAIFDCCPSPPLKWSDLTCQCLIDCARSGVPAELVSMPLTGATSPVTLREAVVQHTAESLSGIVIHQLAHQGSPLIYGGAPSAFDMRHGTTPMGSMETMMIHGAYSEVGKYFGIPTHGYLALSDSKCPDYQAGMETAFGALIAALSGINIVSGPGILDYLLSQSFEKLILDHEACGMALRCARGIEKHPWNPIELMSSLVKQGELLSHPHTRENWRKDLSIAPKIIDRDTYSDWAAKGSQDSQQRAQAILSEKLSQNISPNLDEEAATKLDAIIEKEKSRYS